MLCSWTFVHYTRCCLASPNGTDVVADNELVTPGCPPMCLYYIGVLGPNMFFASAGPGLLEEVLAKRGDAFDRKTTESPSA